MKIWNQLLNINIINYMDLVVYFRKLIIINNEYMRNV